MTNQRKTHATFLSELQGRPLYPIDKYVTARIKIRFCCKIDGHIWLAKPKDILDEKGCPQCKRLTMSVIHMKQNKIIMRDHGTITMDVSTPKHKDVTMLLDANDLPMFEKSGRLLVNDNGYCMTLFDNVPYMIHRVVMGATRTKQQVDHINGIKTDNRRCNLRLCTGQQNVWNAKRSITNTSGRTGVSLTEYGTFRASLTKNGVRVHDSCHKSFDDACKARDSAEIEHHGEFQYKPAKVQS